MVMMDLLELIQDPLVDLEIIKTDCDDDGINRGGNGIYLEINIWEKKKERKLGNSEIQNSKFGKIRENSAGPTKNLQITNHSP